jgi:hypothetical protein
LWLEVVVGECLFRACNRDKNRNKNHDKNHDKTLPKSCEIEPALQSQIFTPTFRVERFDFDLL